MKTFGQLEPSLKHKISHRNVAFKKLKSEMKKCDKLWLASDFDREGESIGWHIQNVLKVPNNCNVSEMCQKCVGNVSEMCRKWVGHGSDMYRKCE